MGVALAGLILSVMLFFPLWAYDNYFGMVVAGMFIFLCVSIAILEFFRPRLKRVHGVIGVVLRGSLVLVLSVFLLVFVFAALMLVYELAGSPGLSYDVKEGSWEGFCRTTNRGMYADTIKYYSGTGRYLGVCGGCKFGCCSNDVVGRQWCMLDAANGSSGTVCKGDDLCVEKCVSPVYTSENFDCLTAYDLLFMR